MDFKGRCITGLPLTRARGGQSCNDITTFRTHLGLFQYKRLNYGTNADIFQFTLQKQLHGLSGVRNIADDIILYEQTSEEHDMNLGNCLQRLFDRGLRRNQAKCSFLAEH